MISKPGSILRMQAFVSIGGVMMLYRAKCHPSTGYVLPCTCSNES